MQQPTIEKIPGSSIKLSFIVTPEEAQSYIDEAVKELSESKPIAGFRPGKAPYTEVAHAHGEMRIWETALERIVRAMYVRAIIDHELDTVGSPEIRVDQLTPKQDIKFTVIAPVAPKVETCADYSKPFLTFHVRDVLEEDIDKALKELRMMQRKEVASTEAATINDVVIIDLEMKKDHVLLEDGSAKNYRIYLAEDHYIPGFSHQLIGLKEGETKTFTLPFPSEHYQKHLAGKDVDFTVTVKQVFTLILPELDDAFAKNLGQESLEQLRSLLKMNIGLEEIERAKQKHEIELLEKLVDRSAFSDIPELLVNEEIRKMIHELEHTVEERGMKMQDYLASLKKSLDELKLEFVPQAIRRIRAATLIKHIAKTELISVTEEELDQEIDHILTGLKKDDTQTRERVSSPEYREYVAIVMRNQKALEILKKRCIEGYPTEEVPSEHVHGPHCHHE